MVSSSDIGLLTRRTQLNPNPFHMSLTGYYFNNILSASDFASLDRFFDEAFNSRQLSRNQAVDTFRPE